MSRWHSIARRCHLPLLLFVFWAQPAAAQAPIAVGPGNVICPAYAGVVAKIVSCMQDVITWATLQFVAAMSGYVTPIISVIAVIAVVIFAIQLFQGEARRVTSQGTILVIKIAAVVFYAANFGAVYPLIIGIANELVQAASNYVTVSVSLRCPVTFTLWQRVDCALNELIGGFVPPVTLVSGVLAFLTACLFSGAVGFAIFLIGLGIIYMVLMAVIKAVFTFLNAYIGIALLSLASPIIFPTIFHRVTKPYFDKWLHLLIGMMLQPVFLFAYLSVMLAAFDVTVLSGPKSLYAAIAGPSALNPSFTLGNYMINVGAYKEAPLGSISSFSVNLKSSELAAGLGLQDTGILGKLTDEFNGLAQQQQIMLGNNAPVTMPVRLVDFNVLAAQVGLTPTQYVVQVLMAFLMTFIILYIIYVLQAYIPYISTFVSGEIMSVPSMSLMSDNMLNKVAEKIAPKPAKAP